MKSTKMFAWGNYQKAYQTASSTTEKLKYFLTKYGPESVKIVPDLAILNRHQCFHLNSGVNPDKIQKGIPRR